MRKTNQNFIWLSIIFCVCLVVSNVVAGKIINTGVIVLGQPITVAGAILCYAITYLITDVVGEIWGQREANRIVKYGFISQIVATAVIWITTYFPAVDPTMQVAYEKLLGQNWVFVMGSLAAYLASQNLDVLIFHKIRDKIISKSKTNKHRWIWNNISTMTSQLVDTIVYIVIAFGFGFGWIINNQIALINMIIGQYLVKFLLALLDTPFFYVLTRKRMAG